MKSAGKQERELGKTKDKLTRGRNRGKFVMVFWKLHDRVG
jgi:uncharacterized protein YheU (UPF0270 family)